VAELPFGITLNAITRHPVPETPRVFYAGRLEAEKGLFDLLDAADRVITRLPSAEFVLAGDGSLRDALAEQIARRGLSGSVRLLGAITPAAVSHEMGLASLVCLPSHGEPFGMVLLEAMRAGRAVVATAEGGPPSIVVDGEGGRLVPTRSPEALAHAIMALLTDPVALVAAGEFNQRRVQEKYDLESVTSTLEGFYETVRRDYHR
jgi:glycosyltransferase involved in cell wall biosynthesis